MDFITLCICTRLATDNMATNVVNHNSQDKTFLILVVSIVYLEAVHP